MSAASESALGNFTSEQQPGSAISLSLEAIMLEYLSLQSYSCQDLKVQNQKLQYLGLRQGISIRVGTILPGALRALSFALAWSCFSFPRGFGFPAECFLRTSPGWPLTGRALLLSDFCRGSCGDPDFVILPTCCILKTPLGSEGMSEVMIGLHPLLSL